MDNAQTNNHDITIAKINAATMLVSDLIKAKAVAGMSTNSFSAACDASDAFNAIYDAIDAKTKQ